MAAIINCANAHDNRTNNNSDRRFVGGCWVFSYGSNSVAQLSARVHNYNLHNYAAKVDNYVRCFCLYSPNWEGTAATILPSPGGTVYGTVTYLSSEEQSRLDQFESAYYKTEIDVTVLAPTLVEELNSSALSATVYIASYPEYRGLPSEAYLTAIRIMLLEHYAEDEVANTITINGLVGGQIVPVSTWKPPLFPQLALPALCIHVNSLRSTSKWVMPKTMRLFVDSFAAIGIHSSCQLAVYLVSQDGIAILKARLRESCKEDVVQYLDDEAVVLFTSSLNLPRLL
jgi:cation transport regulator ChaC